MSQSGGGGCPDDEDGGAGLSSEKRRCLPASLLARCTRRSHAAHSAASSAQQNTDAASAAHTSHCTFILSSLVLPRRSCRRRSLSISTGAAARGWSAPLRALAPAPVVNGVAEEKARAWRGKGKGMWGRGALIPPAARSHGAICALTPSDLVGAAAC